MYTIHNQLHKSKLGSFLPLWLIVVSVQLASQGVVMLRHINSKLNMMNIMSMVVTSPFYSVSWKLSRQMVG